MELIFSKNSKNRPDKCIFVNEKTILLFLIKKNNNEHVLIELIELREEKKLWLII